MLFASSVINYIDRQTLSALAPILKIHFHWTNSDFASLLIAFRLAYTIMQGLGGRLIDVLGSRLGFALVVAFYSVVAMTTSFAQGLASFRIFRFLLGLGEGPNFPGAAKTVAEWFPSRERAWAVALFDSGTSIGGAVAPFIVLYAYKLLGTWRSNTSTVFFFGFVAGLRMLKVISPVGPGRKPRVFSYSGTLLDVLRTKMPPPENKTSVWLFSTPTFDSTQSETTGYSAVLEKVISGELPV